MVDVHLKSKWMSLQGLGIRQEVNFLVVLKFLIIRQSHLSSLFSHLLLMFTMLSGKTKCTCRHLYRYG